MKLWWFKVTAWCLGSWLAIAVLIRIMVFRPVGTADINYSVGKGRCLSGVHYELTSGFERFSLGVDSRIFMGLSDVLFTLYYYPLGWVEGFWLHEDYNDPDLLRRIQGFAVAHELPQKTLCVFNGPDLLTGVIILPSGESRIIWEGALLPPNVTMPPRHIETSTTANALLEGSIP